METDIGILGEGYAGLFALLHLTQQGYPITLVKAHLIGSSASGGHVGQICQGQNNQISNHLIKPAL